MRVVSNTSPVSNLAIIGRLDLLKQRYELVSIPTAVAEELKALSHSGAKSAIEAALAEGWLTINGSALVAPALPHALDAGETAAIGLAIAVKADILLIDEKRGRAAARSLGLTVAGVLGEILHAKQMGIISSVKPELQRLRDDAGFFIDGEIERFILAQTGE